MNARIPRGAAFAVVLGTLVFMVMLAVPPVSAAPLFPGQRLEGRGRTLGPIVADFNEDGADDVIGAINSRDYSYYSAISVTLWLNRGDGAMLSPTLITIGTGSGSVGLSTGDFDQDGHADVAVLRECADSSCTQSQIAILRGDGAGAFALTSVPVGRRVKRMRVGQFDGRDSVDILV